jgi:hypothetical protein
MEGRLIMGELYSLLAEDNVDEDVHIRDVDGVVAVHIGAATAS